MAEKEWYYSDGEEQHGPVSNAELKRLANVGELEPDNLVWCDGMDDWQPASEMKGLIPESKSKPVPARKAPRPARRKSEDDAAQSASPPSDAAKKAARKVSDKDASVKKSETVEIPEPEEEDDVEEVEEVVDDEEIDLGEDDEEDFDEEPLEESLGQEGALPGAGVSHSHRQQTVVNVTQPPRSMAHSLVLLIVWASSGLFVAVGGAIFVMKWQSLEESAAVTAEAGAFLVQFVGAYVFARAIERVLQLLADMSRR